MNKNIDITESKIVNESDLISILNELFIASNPIQEILPALCDQCLGFFQSTGNFTIRIKYNNQDFTSNNFMESHTGIIQEIEIPGSSDSSLELFYTDKAIPVGIIENDKKILCTLSQIISGLISKYLYKKLLYDNTERLKELKGINQTTAVLNRGNSIEESLQEICNLIPEAWQYPTYTVVRITYEDKIFISNNFQETPWIQRQIFETPGDKKGMIEVYYLKKFPDIYEGSIFKRRTQFN